MRGIATLILTLCIMSPVASGQNIPEIDTELSCEACHVGGDWNSGIGDNFDHIITGYELSGIHGEIDCVRCHTGSTPAEKHDFGQASSDCASCHADVHNDQWGQDCERCHRPDTWALSTEQQNHDLTTFPLQGPHRSLGCESCHLSNPGTGSSLPLDCVGCHSQQYEASTRPAHQVLNLGDDCESCHAPQTTVWNSSTFDHNDTGFFLLGMHGTARCSSCHTQPAESTPSACRDCHISDFIASSDPEHESAGYPLDCELCHDSFNWNSTFLHEETGFLLTGAHETTLCIECHNDQNYGDTPETCFDCHQPAWEASEPPHEDAPFSAICEDCHSTTAWLPSSWSHDTDTEYPLTGAHIGPDCESCHTVSPYANQSSLCVDCHESDYTNTLEPNHITNSIPTTCEVCHSTDNWSSEEIDHDQTGFPLLGAHASLNCAGCHADGYDIESECQSCHMDDFTSTSNSTSPDHTQYGFSQDCLNCHGQTSWKPSFFSHSLELTGFAIQGAHLSLLPENCFSCHESGQWSGLSTECFSCHEGNFENTSDPDHDTRGYPQHLCESCHSQDAWVPSTFAHSQPSITCATCHMVEYGETTEPPHNALSFSTDCSSCHGVNQWSPSSYAHDLESTGFLIEGAHLQVSCISCHSTWDPPTEIRTCAAVSCHLSDYQSATNPNHASASFPLNCESCHTSTNWVPSSFDHDGQYFPIYNGQHRNEWNDCSQCHVDGNDFAVFTCFGSGCHNVAEMNDEHCVEGDCESCGGQTYPTTGVTPEDCLSCHPNGNEDDCDGGLMNFFKIRTLSFPSEKKIYEPR